MFAGSVEREGRLAKKVSGFGNQRIALPAAARVPAPLAHVRPEMRTSVQRDYARVVDLLVEDDKVITGLEQLNVVVVRTRSHRRSGVVSKYASHPQPRG